MASVNFNNNKFNGKLDGKRASDYYNEAKEFMAPTAKDMIDRIKDVLGAYEIEGKEFYDTFWEKVFIQNDNQEDWEGGIKLVLNKEDSLYSDSNIAGTLELMGTYIIKSERKRDNPEDYMRVYHSNEMFKKAIDEQNALRHLIDNSPNGKYAKEKGLDEYYVLANQTNYKMEKRLVKLTNKDLEQLDEIYGSKYNTVHEYYLGYLKMRELLADMNNVGCKKKLTKDDKVRHKTIKKNIKSLKDDFIECINKKSRPIVFKAPLPDKGCPEWDLFDETDAKHIRAALRINRGNDMQDDVSVIIKDLHNTINECDFTPKQKRIIELLRTDLSFDEIALEMNSDKGSINKYVNSICKKIVKKNYEKIENWYYLNILKGKYKKCSKCGEIKLISRFSKNGNRTQSRCKSCQSVKNK